MIESLQLCVQDAWETHHQRCLHGPDGKHLARTPVEESAIQQWITLKLLNDWKRSLLTLPSHCREPTVNSSTTPFFSWLAAGTGITAQHGITQPCGSVITFSKLKRVSVGREFRNRAAGRQLGANLHYAAICWTVVEQSEKPSAAVLKRKRSAHIFAMLSHKQSRRFKITQGLFYFSVSYAQTAKALQYKGLEATSRDALF